ncbi:tail protein X [Kushneria phosphatilytica]|uniref:Phage tail protein n=1 Tax=Kushneria phosphatilytica TaxID=657387 RepID=A0A1S1NW42_9GAMM|nr:tail protein X [Kushneria phosphatilytica]OHV11208.1 phage tail protein [Kushneria phosphatilytica]QEL12219.1 phage tail protein [Kushneria phosphatilytica]
MARTVRSQQGDTLDRLCQRYYGRTDVTERVYAANPGLCELGPILPMATAITLPDITTPAPKARTVQLWD